ncbi:MAG: hypothetical protein R3D28_24055 [Geminicoccaceae bacterium]|nr:hypothetical protein [Geminicoccaceae bacterium]HRY27187.1 hypothetical protein [Geminicoccaceae bacterium]
MSAWVKEETRGGVVHVEAGGDDRRAVQAAVSDYLRRWPPAGYDTRFGTVARSGDGFRAVGSRLRSCD